MKEIPLWIRLYRLHLSCWSDDSLSHIRSVLGKPVCADECTSQQMRISYVGLLVEVDVTKPMIYKIQIEDDKGVRIEQQVVYEWIPMFCQKCQRLGYICKKNEVPVQPQKQLQPKDKGKAIQVENEKDLEKWSKPKNPVVFIQVGHLQVPTDNTF